MSLILHHAQKDLRAQRWLVAAWAAALLALSAVDIARPDLLTHDLSSRRPADAPAGYLLTALAVVRVLLTWLIAVRIVHADPLDSTDAFWLTRPLSRRALLAAKAGLIGALFVVVPALASGTIFAAVGVPAGVVPTLAARWVLIELVLLLPVVLVASLTRDLARIVILFAVVLAAWVVLQMRSAGTYLDDTYSELIGDWASVAAAWAGTLTSFAAVTAALVAWHYLTRQRRNTALASGAAVLLCAGLAWAWPVRLMLAQTRQLRTEGTWIKSWDGGRSLTFDVVPDSLATRPAQAGRADTVFGRIRATGLEDGVVFDTMSGSKASLTFPGSEPFLHRDMYWRAIDTFPGVAQSEDNNRVVERVLGARLIDNPSGAINRGFAGAELMALPPASYGRFQDTPGTFEADLNLLARRIAVAAAIPLRRGASAQLGDVSVSIDETREDTDRPFARSRYFGKSRFFVVTLQVSAPRTLSTRTTGRTGCLLLNRRRGEAVPLLDGGTRRAPTNVSRLASFAAWSLEREVFHPLGGEATSPDQATWRNRAWLAEAELVFLSSEVLGTFTGHIFVPDFRLPGRPNAQSTVESQQSRVSR